MKSPAITNVSLKNFRGFKKSADIPMTPLTFLVGPNSSGKSTLSDSLMFIAQSNMMLGRYTGSFTPNWIGSLVDLGSFNDTVFKHSPNLAIEIGFELQIEPSVYGIPEWGKNRMRYEFVIRKNTKDDTSFVRFFRLIDCLTGESISIEVSPGTKWKLQFLRNKSRLIETLPLPNNPIDNDLLIMRLERILRRDLQKTGSVKSGKGAAWKRILRHFGSMSTNRFFRDISRVSSGRGGPSRWYVAEQSNTLRNPGLMSAGNTFDSLTPEMVDAAAQEYELYGRRKNFLSKRHFTPPIIGMILKELGIGDQIQPERSTPYHSALNIRDHLLQTQANIVDVGYGASQVIPVILACSTFSPSPLVVEQPEIHLHPRAQGIVGDLLCETSKHRQVIVETHSAHLINRARILAAEGRLNPNDVTILYVDRNESGSNVTPIFINKVGDFSNDWPSGFFDERYEETMSLLRLKQKVSTEGKSK
ncbi:MAG: DUF3696 domain-containing protein [Alphaproteobacteria bacterium]|nr:MAG: DUF3696 domain-containing protein [Alphaproteobacteria bacterium]